MQLTKESELPEKYEAVIKPWFDVDVQAGLRKLGDGVSIHYRYAHNVNAKSVIVVSSGRVECAVKYAELIYDLFHNGHSVFIHDHRGQGLSSRTTENPHHGYIDGFSQYVSDFEHMIDDVLMPILNKNQQNLPLHLLCHSMGSTIGALLVLSRPQMFSKAVFCSPMFGITPPLPQWLATILVYCGVTFNKLMKKQSAYFLGQGDYRPTAFHENHLMSSEVRYRIFRKAYSQQPELRLGGVTHEWLHASIVAMKKIREEAKTIQLPCQILYSGADTVVANKDIEKVIADISNCDSKCIPEAMHELFFEKDKFRVPALTQILTFFGAQSLSSPSVQKAKESFIP
ncbi:MAG: lysophospholipase [Glaciecola sp.]|jgi:lysophospholipase